MQMDRLTIKSQEALHRAQRLAEQRHHPEVDVEHLLLALVEQEEGVVRPLLGRLGIATGTLQDRLEQALKGKPTVSGASQERYISRALRKVLDHSFELAEKMKDEYVSTEHLLLAAIDDKDSPVAGMARDLGLTPDATLKALQTVRGSQRVTDPSPEDNAADGWASLSYLCARSPSRSFSAIRSRRLLGASTLTSGIQERTQRISSLRPVVSMRISTRPSRRIRNRCVGCQSRSVM